MGYRDAPAENFNPNLNSHSDAKTKQGRVKGNEKEGGMVVYTLYIREKQLRQVFL